MSIIQKRIRFGNLLTIVMLTLYIFSGSLIVYAQDEIALSPEGDSSTYMGCVTVHGNVSQDYADTVFLELENAATGENPVVVMAPRADVIIGPVGIAVADSMMGEVTPKMAMAVGQSSAKKILIPINRCDIMIAGVADLPLTEMIRRVIAMLRQ